VLKRKAKNMKSKYNYLPNSRFLKVLANSVPIDLPNILGQRYCDPREVFSALEKRNGFDKGMFRPPFVIAVRKEVARTWVEKQENPTLWDGSFAHGINEQMGMENMDDYALFLFDGKHRAEMLKAVDGTITHFPVACVYFVENVEKGNELFNEFNERANTKVSPETMFINDYLAKAAIKISSTSWLDSAFLVKRLEEAGAVICDKKDYFVVPQSSKADTTIPSITANVFKLLNDETWHPDFEFVKIAMKFHRDFIARSKTTIKQAKDKNKKARPEYNNWIISGMATLFRLRPELLDEPEPMDSMLAVFTSAYDAKKGNLKGMIKQIRDDAISNGDLSVEAKDVNSNKIWAKAFASVIKEHGETYGVSSSKLSKAVSLNTLWRDLESDADSRKIARAKARKVA
jgi:hypothetical protein